MKKIIYILCSMLLVIVGYRIIDYYIGYRLNVDDSCVTREKIDKESKKYREYVFDENGNHKLNAHGNLTRAMYEEINKDGKYKIFILSGEDELYISDPQKLDSYIFLGILIDKYSKNEAMGQQDFLLIEDAKTGKEVFRMKRYQIYPYKRMVNTTYSGGASVVVQFKCKIYGK